MWLFVPPALLILVFPDGRLPGRHWRWVGYGLVIVPLLFLLPAAADPTPFEPPYADVPHLIRLREPWNELVGIFGVALLPIFLGLLVASVASLVARYRQASEVVRTQLKWFVLGAMFLPATLLLGWAGFLFLDNPDLVLLGFALTYLALPLATAIAVLRYDLYDVDKAISTAVTYGLITAALLTVFAFTSFAVGLIAGQASPIAAAAATAICAAVLAPLRTRLQRWVDRRAYPLRRAALAAIDGLRVRADAGVAQPEQLEPALQSALRDPELRVGYLVPGRIGLVAADGSRLPDDGVPRCPYGPAVTRSARSSAGPWPPRSCSRNSPTPARCSSRSSGCGSSSGRRSARWSPAGHGCCTPATKSAAGWNATCMTAHSSGWSPWAWRCGSPSATSTTPSSTSTVSSTPQWPSWPRLSPSFARSRMG